MMRPIHNFHVIVNALPEEPGERARTYYTVVAEAPVPRFGYHMGRFVLTRNEMELWFADKTRIPFARDLNGAYRMDGAGLGPERVGEALFELLFPTNSEIRELLLATCARVWDGFLRIRLELHADLHNLPWEAIHCPLGAKGAVVFRAIPYLVVRYFGASLPASIPASNQKKPVILLISAIPAGVDHTLVTQSFMREVELVKMMSEQYEVLVVEGENTKLKLVRQIAALKASNARIAGIHWVGHGGVDEDGTYLVAEAERREKVNLYAVELLDILKQAGSIEWALLNACWTAASPIGSALAGVATALIVQKEIPLVLAYDRAINTDDAELLARAFYSEYLVQDRPIEEVLGQVIVQCKDPHALVTLQRSVEGTAATTQRGPRAGFFHEQGGESAGKTHKQGPAGKSAGPEQAPPPENAASDESVEIGSLIRIPSGPLKRGLSVKQCDSVIQQIRAFGFNLDWASVRAALKKEPEERVEIPEFLIQNTAVTNAQFAAFVQARQYVTTAEAAGESETWRSYFVGRADHPVVCVSFDDAKAYATWAGLRLPTADEWRKAYGGPEGRIYPWGEEFSTEHCNTAESCAGFQTTPVTRFPNGRSYHGCYDMLGNVEEWTTNEDPEGFRQLFGGSWKMSCQLYGLPVLHRMAHASEFFSDTGFRCARNP
jgi:formylglycine-generating enzyme required for sulfatase activity